MSQQNPHFFLMSTTELDPALSSIEQLVGVYNISTYNHILTTPNLCVQNQHEIFSSKERSRPHSSSKSEVVDHENLSIGSLPARVLLFSEPVIDPFRRALSTRDGC